MDKKQETLMATARALLILLMAEVKRIQNKEMKFLAAGVSNNENAFYIAYVKSAHADITSALAAGELERIMMIYPLEEENYNVDYRTALPSGQHHLAVSLSYTRLNVEDPELHLAADIYNWLVAGKLPEFQTGANTTTTLQ